MSRNKTMKVGTTAQNATPESTAERVAVESLSFPRKLRVTNQMPIMLVLPEFGLQLIGNTRKPKPGERNSADVKFASEDQLKRFEADAEALANIHNYNPAVLIEEIEAIAPGTSAATTAPPKAAPGSQQTEAAAVASAPVPAANENPAGA